MEKVVEKMAKFFGSPIAKWVGCLLAAISVIALTSFTTNRNVKEQLSDYVSYQNKQEKSREPVHINRARYMIK